MSTDLDRTLARLYAALGDDAQVAPLPAAAALRAEGDRRTTRRTVLAGVAATVLLAGVAAGGALVLGGGDVRVIPAPPPGPEPSVSAVPTTPPSATPSVTTPPPSTAAATLPPGERPRPTVVPDGVFLTGEELHTRSDLSQPTGRFLPSLCRYTPHNDPVVVRRSLGGYVSEPGTPPDSAPGAQLAQSVTVFEHPTHAWRFTESLRGAPATCPTETITAGKITYRLLDDAAGVGTDAVLIEQKIPATDFVTGEPVAGTWTFYTAAVRHGDVVVVLYTYPYENWGLDENPAFMVDLLRKAYDKVVAWRGPVSATPQN
jgi:hypothetical protein